VTSQAPAAAHGDELDDLPDAFYRRVGIDTFAATEATQSPWDTAAQHGGPPTALLVAAVERTLAGSGLRVTTVTADFLGVIPLQAVTVTARVMRAGRRVQLVEATMHADATAVAVARCWATRADTHTTPRTAGEAPPPRPDQSTRTYLPGVSSSWPYGRAIDWRFVNGAYDQLGPASVWTRTRLPLLDDEPTSALQRMAIVADSANGLSSELDIREWLYVPPSITIAAGRHQLGDWLHLDAHTLISGDGTGTAHADLSDELGPLGTCSQPLLVAPRPQDRTSHETRRRD
jgi:hypothetical protein